MRIGAGMPEVIRQCLDLGLRQPVLRALGRLMQLIERPLAVGGEIALPEPVPTQDMEPQSLARVGQLEKARLGPHQSGGLESLDQMQHRARRQAEPAPDVRARDRAAFLPGAAQLLERVLPEDAPAPPAPAPAEHNKAGHHEHSDGYPQVRDQRPHGLTRPCAPEFAAAPSRTWDLFGPSPL